VYHRSSKRRAEIRSRIVGFGLPELKPTEPKSLRTAYGSEVKHGLAAGAVVLLPETDDSFLVRAAIRDRYKIGMEIPIKIRDRTENGEISLFAKVDIPSGCTDPQKVSLELLI